MPTTPFVPAENVMQVEFRFTQYGQQAENVLYVRREDEDALTPFDYEAVASALYGNWLTNAKPLHASNVVLREIFITDLTTQTSPTYLLSLNDAGTGLPGMASSITLTTTFVSAGRGRSSRGRNYWIGIPQASVTGNTIDAIYAGAVLSYYNSVYNELGEAGVGFRHVLVSRRADNAWRPTALVIPVTGYRQVDNNVDSQRRRLTGRGL